MKLAAIDDGSNHSHRPLRSAWEEINKKQPMHAPLADSVALTQL